LLKPLEKLPLYVSAAAASIVLLACIAIGAALYWMAIWVSVTIALFYVIGEFVRFFLTTKVFPPEDEPVEMETLIEDYGEEEFDEAVETEPESAPVEDAFLDD